METRNSSIMTIQVHQYNNELQFLSNLNIRNDQPFFNLKSIQIRKIFCNIFELQLNHGEISTISVLS